MSSPDPERVREATKMDWSEFTYKGNSILDFPPFWDLLNAARAYRDYLADPVAAAANLDGAKRISELPKTCKHGQTTMHDHPNGESRCAGPIAEAKHYLRIPLPDKETPNE